MIVRVGQLSCIMVVSDCQGGSVVVSNGSQLLSGWSQLSFIMVTPGRLERRGYSLRDYSEAIHHLATHHLVAQKILTTWLLKGHSLRGHSEATHLVAA